MIAARVTALNDAIATERSLGEQYRVGHSYVTPTRVEADWRAWFAEVVETEIAPLLAEYWYDDPATAAEHRAKLLQGF